MEIIGQIRSATNGNYALCSKRFQKKSKSRSGGGRGEGRPAGVYIDEANQLGLL